MKRAKQLQPLSREHHLGLVTARHAKECNDADQLINTHWQKLVDYIDGKMANHFMVEDDLILATTTLVTYQEDHPEVKEVMDEIARQHEELDRLIAVPEGQTKPSAEQVTQLANTLYDHIRFEERKLFPLIEELLTEEELDAIYEASSKNVKRPDENR